MSEETKKPISYSPSRLSQAFYCGKLAAHSRTKGGNPETYGVRFGSAVDEVIENFYKENIYVPSEELHYALLVTPPKTETTQAQEAFEFEFGEGENRVSIRGYIDLTFDEFVVEIKTGEAKDWHKIQALIYAIVKKRPVRIVYVTQRFHITVQPDEDRLREIIQIAIDNEKNQYVSRNEHCAYCALKSDCEAWNKQSALARVLIGLKEILNEEDWLTDDIKKVEKMFNECKDLSKVYMSPLFRYASDGHTVSAKEDSRGRYSVRVTSKKYGEDENSPTPS